MVDKGGRECYDEGREIGVPHFFMVIRKGWRKKGTVKKNLYVGGVLVHASL